MGSSSNFWDSLYADIFIITSAPRDRWQCPTIDFSFLRFKEILGKNNPDSFFFFIGPYKSKNPKKKELFIGPNPEIEVYNAINKLVLHESDRIQNNITNLPKPDYELVKNIKYAFDLLSGKFFLIEISRGCPNKCSFCNKTMYPKYQKKTLTQIRNELNSLHKLGIETLEFIDLDFLIDKKFSLQVCNILSDFSPRFKYAIQTRCNNVDEELIKKLKESGCEIIQFGVETFSEKILKDMDKPQDILVMKRAFNLCKKQGIKTLAYMITGFPGQEKKHRNYDLAMLKKIEPDYVSILPFVDYSKSKTYGITEARVMTKEFYLRPKWIMKTIKNNSLKNLFLMQKKFIEYLLRK